MNVNSVSGTNDAITKDFVRERENECSERFLLKTNSRPSTKSGIYLYVGGLASCGTPDGSNITIYKSDSYSSDNPELKIVRRYPDGSKKESFVDPREIDPTDATESEMFALHTYLVTEGKVDVDISRTGILEGSCVSTSISDERADYMSITKEMLMMQYNAHNFKGYAELAKVLASYNAFLDGKR